MEEVSGLLDSALFFIRNGIIPQVLTLGTPWVVIIHTATMALVTILMDGTTVWEWVGFHLILTILTDGTRTGETATILMGTIPMATAGMHGTV